MVLATEKQNMVIRDIIAEMVRQEKKFGPADLWGHSNDRHLVILMEEVGECADAANEGEITHLREELIQVAAVAFQHILAIDREKK